MYVTERPYACTNFRNFVALGWHKLNHLFELNGWSLEMMTPLLQIELTIYRHKKAHLGSIMLSFLEIGSVSLYIYQLFW